MKELHYHIQLVHLGKLIDTSTPMTKEKVQDLVPALKHLFHGQRVKIRVKGHSVNACPFKN